MDEKYILVGEKMPHAVWGKPCFENAIINYNEQDKYYWISIGLFGLNRHVSGNGKSVIVLSGTPEYESITELIKLKDNSVIEKYAQILAIKYMSPEDVYFMIEKTKHTSYNRGCKDTQSKIREALGIKTSKNSPYLIPEYL